jgi:iron complex transport system substrate-binding protein
MRALWLTLFVLISTPAWADKPSRVVTLGGALTEIVYALNAGGLLVGVDQSSIYPPAATSLPQVGYYRAFSVEGVATLKPDLVLATDQAGPPEALQQLQQLGLRVVILPAAPSLDALEQRINGVAMQLAVPERGTLLIAQIRNSLAAPTVSAAPRTLLLMGRDGGLQGAGKDTAADAMLRLAGAVNVLASQQGYKPLSPEAAAALRPDVIVATRMTLESAGGLEKLLGAPGIALTPAARQGRVVVMDDLLLLGFGPRLPEALRELRAGLSAPATLRP